MRYSILVIAVVLVVGFVVYNGNRYVSREKDQRALSGSTSAQIPVIPSVGGQRLDRSHEGLIKIDASFFESNTATTELDLSYNHLSGALPAEIRHWKYLRVLNVSHNQMTGLPAELGQLENLETLDVSYNKLTGLPYELGNLKKLRILNLAGNSYSQEDLHVIRQKIPQTQIIVR